MLTRYGVVFSEPASERSDRRMTRLLSSDGAATDQIGEPAYQCDHGGRISILRDMGDGRRLIWR